MIEQSETVGELFKALIAAQKEFPKIRKSKTGEIPLKNGGNYSYRYADLEAVLDKVLPILHANGLAIMQPPVVASNGKGGLATQLIHESGEWLRATMELTVTQTTAQGQGSAISYARRYQACAMLGIVASTDDDGKIASNEGNGESRRRQSPVGSADEASDVFMVKLRDSIQELSTEQKGELKKAWKREMIPPIDKGLSAAECAMAQSLVNDLKRSLPAS